MAPHLRDRGQASLEYVALLALLVVALGTALAFGGALPRLDRTVVATVRHGVCLVSGGVCTPGEARAAGLAPCPLFRRSADERASASVVMIALQRGDSMALERRSDGTASVSFMDGESAGYTGGVGVRLSPLGVQASADYVAGAAFTAGRTWEFSTVAAAEAFVRRYAADQSLGGEVREVGHDLCFLCPGWLRGHGRPELPPPSSRSIEGGVFAQATATLGLSAAGIDGVSADPSVGAVLGRQTAGSRTTWYLGLDGSLLLHLGPVLSPLAGARSASAVVELTSDHGRPVELRVRAAATASGDPVLSMLTMSDAQLGDALRASLAGAGPGGRALEAEVALDLRDPANLAAVQAFLSGGLPRPEEVAALGRRLTSDAAVDLHLFDYHASDFDVSGELGFGGRVGAEYQRSVEVRRLLGAWSRRPGGPVRPREDCTGPAP